MRKEYLSLLFFWSLSLVEWSKRKKILRYISVKAAQLICVAVGRGRLDEWCTLERFSFTLTWAKNRVCVVCIHVTSHFFVLFFMPKSTFRYRNSNFHIFILMIKKLHLFMTSILWFCVLVLNKVFWNLKYVRNVCLIGFSASKIETKNVKFLVSKLVNPRWQIQIFWYLVKCIFWVILTLTIKMY